MATTPGYRANYISVNQEEAADKISIARMLYHSIPDALKESGYKPPLWVDSKDELALHEPPYTSLIHSQPASAAVRGGKKDIYFDEAAHIRDFPKLYQAALPAITRGEGRITICSTPLGQSGLFYDICTLTEEYNVYTRHSVPWWESRYMVRPEFVADGWVRPEVLVEAPNMGTVERVAKFGSDKIKLILKSFGNDIQGFMTEYEAQFVDELSAFYPWELVSQAINYDLPVLTEIPEGWRGIGSVAIGVDLAKSKDESVFTVTDTVADSDTVDRYVVYTHATQDSYEEQFHFLVRLIEQTHATRVSIDQTGVGQVFVERAKKSAAGTVIEGVVFTNPKKEKWATQMKADLQAGRIHIPPIGELMRQIHGIQRTKSEAGFYKFSGGRGYKRDDYFWSTCLGFYGEGRVEPRISFL